MFVTNNTSYPIIAFCWIKDGRFGLDTTIEPGTTGHIFGPAAGKWEGHQGYEFVAGTVVCYDRMFGCNGYPIAKGQPLSWDNGNGAGVTIRHHLDERVPPGNLR